MTKKTFSIATMFCMATMAGAQSIDFNFSNAQDDVKCEPGYVAWNVPQAASSSMTLDNGLNVTIAATGNANILRDQWHKNTCQWGQKDNLTGNRLFGDGAVAFIADDDNNTPNQTKIGRAYV